MIRARSAKLDLPIAPFKRGRMADSLPSRRPALPPIQQKDFVTITRC
jgi:hypothetical protein